MGLPLAGLMGPGSCLGRCRRLTPQHPDLALLLVGAVVLGFVSFGIGPIGRASVRTFGRRGSAETLAKGLQEFSCLINLVEHLGVAPQLLHLGPRHLPDGLRGGCQFVDRPLP